MQNSIPGLDHIAIVVPSIEEGLAFYQKTLNLELLETEIVQSQGVKVAKLQLANTHIELLEPLDDTNSIAKFLKNKGSGIHHICLSVNNIKEYLFQLENNEICLINKEPVKGASNKQIAFIHPKSTCGVLLELSQS